MKEIIDILRDRAKKAPKRIVFPEANDERVIKAIDYIKKEKLAYPLPLNPSNLDPRKKKKFAEIFYQKKRRGISWKKAKELMETTLYYAAMMVYTGEEAEGFVAGAVYTTSAVVRAALNCLDIDPVSGLLSSCFIMVVPDCLYGEKGVLIYADCGVIPYPTSEQLASIAILTANFTQEVLEFTPRVAMLSFSTHRSAEGKWVDKVREAVKIVKSRSNNKFFIDGELQADSALVKEVAKVKVKNSEVAGQANVLIFPNLDAGNICYKLTERLAKARAIGPILLGTKQPCSDLSRGCSVDDIIDCTAVTVIRIQKKEELMRMKKK